MKRMGALPLGIFLLISSLLPAQDVAGSLEGRILDPEGAALAAVQVAVSGPSLQGPRQTRTDEQGGFRFLSLPSGIYQVRVRHEAFLDLVFENVTVRLGATTSLGRLKLQQKVSEAKEVVVTADRPLIDLTSTVTGANLTAEAIRDLPVARDYQSVMSILPAANQSYYGDAVNVSGATGSENSYFIDGMDVSDPYMRYRNTSLPYNFIREIEIRTGGYQAEYRSSLGGLVNAVTYSGGNTFAGQLFGFYSGNRYMQEGFRPELEPGSGDYAQYDFGFSLGGPIVRDKLWFFGAYNPTTVREDVLIPGLDFYRDKTTRHIFAGKLTWQPSSRANFVFTALGDPMKQNSVGIGWPASAALNPDPYLTEVKGGGYNFLASGKYMVSDKVLLETSLAYITRQDRSGPATERGLTELFFTDEAAGNIVSGGHVGVDDRQSSQFTLSGKGTIDLGDHLLKAGFEYRDNKLDSFFDNRWVFGLGDSGYVYQIMRGEGTVHNRLPSLFVQDSWRVNDRLQINGGLRWTGEFLVASDGKVSQTILDELQPRLGFVYQPGELGRSKLHGSFGRYFQEFSTLLMTWYQMEDFIFQWLVYDHDPRTDPSGAEVGTEWTGGISPKVEGLNGQNFDEFTLGYEQAIGSNFKLGVLGIYRHLRDGVEDGDDPVGGGGYGNPGRPPLQSFPKLKREYYGLELTFAKVGGKHLDFSLSYVLSRSYGNYPGLFAQDLGDKRPNVSGQFDSVEEVVDATGLLPNDRPHVFKLSGTYRFDFGVSVGAFFLWQSGTPLSEMGTQTMIPGWIKFLTARGSAGRTPSIADLNIRVAYEVKNVFGSRFAPRIILDVFHIGSNRTPVTYNQRHYFGVDDAGNQTDLNPLYLHADGYFPPMSARLGFEVNF